MMRENRTKAQLTLRDQVKHPVLSPNNIPRKEMPGMDYESFPTPCAQDYKHRGPSSRQTGLPGAVRLRPLPPESSRQPDGGGNTGGNKGLFLTPRATDTGKGEKQETFLKRTGDRTDASFQSLPAQIGGQLNADWVEALMGYPLYWTDVEKDCPLENRCPGAWLDGAWEDGVPRVTTGQKHRPSRIKALGNSIVPQIPCLIFLSNDFDKWR
jgi:DNA (cytosine-5)-methyltransferase 1